MYLSVVNFKTKDQKFLKTLLIFTPIPLVPKKCGVSINFYEFVQGRMREHPTLTYKTISCSYKNYVCFSPYNWLSNWANFFGPFQLGFSVCLEWDQKETNKNVAPMGIELFCQLLTSPKFPLIIFNITI